jgi:hypothetical protein
MVLKERKERLLERQEKVFNCAEGIRITILKEFPTSDLDSCARIMSSLIGAAAVPIESCEDAKAALDCFTSSLEHRKRVSIGMSPTRPRMKQNMVGGTDDTYIEIDENGRRRRLMMESARFRRWLVCRKPGAGASTGAASVPRRGVPDGSRRAR